MAVIGDFFKEAVHDVQWYCEVHSIELRRPFGPSQPIQRQAVVEQ
jgi:hypothetical protein